MFNSDPGGLGKVYPLVGKQYGAGFASGSNSVRFGGPPFNAGEGLIRFAGDLNSGIALDSDPLGGGGPTTPLTIAFWVNPESFVSSDGSDPRFVSLQADFVVSTSTGDIIVFGRNGAASEVKSAESFSFNTWQHVVCTFDGTTMLIYKNGVLCTMSASVIGNSGDAGQFTIACRNNAGARAWPGRMADVMLCVKTVLNAGEVATLYGSYFLQQRELPALFAAGGGSSFLAAWAANSNLPVIGTGTY